MKKMRTILAKMTFAMILVTVLSMLMPGEVEAAVKLNKSSVTLLKNKTYTIKVKGTKKKATWKTSKKSVVKLTSKKKKSVKIKAVKAGKAVVSAKIGKKTYKCKVTVVDPQISKKAITMTEGEGVGLTVKNGTGKIIWKSSNPSVVTVNSAGKLSALKAGTAKVTAKQNGRTLSCSVTVAKKAADQKGTETNDGGSDDSGKNSKQVWVVTREAEIVYIPIYQETYYFECTTCGELFNMETEAEKYDDHEWNHMLNGQPGGWRDKVDRVIIDTKVIEYPEQGYWMTVYY